MGDFDISTEDDLENDILEEEIEEVNFPNPETEFQTMEEFFDFEAYERDSISIESEANLHNNADASQGDKEWSVDDIIQEFS